MRRSLLGLLLAFTLANLLSGQVPSDVLLKLKAATVFVKVRVGDLKATGSGFVFRVDGKSALIATNEHVVVLQSGQNSTVDVVFNSGRAKAERVVRAEILATDRERDLAVLRVQNVEDLPTAIPVPEMLDIVETQGVFALGFPFGTQLTDGKNPAVTIGKGSISSLREDASGKLKAVQIDGDLNPGNSGGPVVDEKGNLVGVAVAAVRGTRIGLAVPGTQLQALLHGRPGDVSVQPVRLTEGNGEMRVEVQLIDPLHKLKEVSILVTPADTVRFPLQAGNDGNFPPLPGGKEFPLKVEDQKATGKVTLPTGGANFLRLVFQPVYVNHQNAKLRVQPSRPLVADFARITPAAETNSIIGAGKVEPFGEPIVTAAKLGTGSAPTLCWAADGKAFYHLDGAGTVRRISFPELNVEVAQETGKKCTWLSVSALGPIVTIPEAQGAWLLDPKTLTVRTKLAVGNARRVVSAAPLLHAFADDERGTMLRVLDLKENKMVKVFRPGDFEIPSMGFGHLTPSPDGRYLFTTGGVEQVFRLRIEGAEIIAEEASPRLLQGRFIGPCVSNDGAHVCAPAGGGNYGLPGEAMPRPYRTFVYNTKSFKKPAVILNNGGYPDAVGFDIASGLIYTQGAKPLMVFDTQGNYLREIELSLAGVMGSPRAILVHPEGRKLLLLVDHKQNTTVVAVQLPTR